MLLLLEISFRLFFSKSVYTSHFSDLCSGSVIEAEEEPFKRFAWFGDLCSIMC